MSFVRCMILLALAIISPHAISAEIPKTEGACIAAGGNWTILGLPYPDKTKVCDMKAPDYGKECSDSDECEGSCTAPENAIGQQKVNGTCSEYILNYGGLRTVESGRVSSWSVE